MVPSWCWLSAFVLGQPLPLVPPGAQGETPVPKPVSASPGEISLQLPMVENPGQGKSPARRVLSDRQDAGGAEWKAPLKLNPALENVYRGTILEECFTPQTQYSRGYRLESRVLVLGQESEGWDLAFLTTLREKETPKSGQAFSRENAGSTSRLTKCKVDSLGHLESSQIDTLRPVGPGITPHETGMVVELPPGKMRMGEPWETREGNNPVIRWELKGREVLLGNACLLVVGEQKTETWDKPRADRGAWRRMEKVWISQRTGLAAKVERTLEKREPARQEISEKTVVRYELDSSVQYPQPLYEDRVKDVEQTLKLTATAEPLLVQGPKQASTLTKLLKKTEKVFEMYPPTPFRAAFGLEKRRVESAIRGEIPAPEQGRVPEGIAGENTAKPANGASVGSAAPDFTVPKLGGQGSLALRNCRGSHVLMVFYNPSAPMTEEVLIQVRNWSDSCKGQDLSVLPLSVRTDSASNQKWTGILGKELPIHDGSGLRITYGVEVTPRIVLIDKQGIVRALHEGWGGETRQQCKEDLLQLLAESKPNAKAKASAGN